MSCGLTSPLTHSERSSRAIGLPSTLACAFRIAASSSEIQVSGNSAARTLEPRETANRVTNGKDFTWVLCAMRPPESNRLHVPFPFIDSSRRSRWVRTCRQEAYSLGDYARNKRQPERGHLSASGRKFDRIRSGL